MMNVRTWIGMAPLLFLILLVKHTVSVTAVTVTSKQQHGQYRSSTTKTIRGISNDNQVTRRIKNGGTMSSASCKMSKNDEPCAPSPSPVSSVSSQSSTSTSSTTSAKTSATKSPTPSPNKEPTPTPTMKPTLSPTTPSPTERDIGSDTSILDSSKNNNKKQCNPSTGSNQRIETLTFAYQHESCPSTTTTTTSTCTDNANQAGCKDMTDQIVRMTCFPHRLSNGVYPISQSPVFYGFLPDASTFGIDLQRHWNQDNQEVDISQLKCEITSTKLEDDVICQILILDVTGKNDDFETGNQYGSLQLTDCELTSPTTTITPDTTPPPSPTTTSPESTSNPTTPNPTTPNPTPSPTIDETPSDSPTVSQEPTKTQTPTLSNAPSVSPTETSPPSLTPTEEPPFETDQNDTTGEFLSKCSTIGNGNIDDNNKDDDEPKILVSFQYRATVLDTSDDDTDTPATRNGHIRNNVNDNDDGIETVVEKIEERAHLVMARRFLDCIFSKTITTTTGGATRRILQNMISDYRILDNGDDDDDDENKDLTTDLDVTSISSLPKAQVSKTEFCSSSSSTSLQRDDSDTTSCHVVNDGIIFTAINGTNLSNDTIKTAFGNLLTKAMGSKGTLRQAHANIKNLEFVGITKIGYVNDGNGNGIDGIIDEPQPVDSGNNRNLVTPFAIAGAAVLVIVGLALYRRRRQQEQNHQDNVKNRTFESLEDDSFVDEMNLPVMGDEDHGRYNVAPGARSVTSDNYDIGTTDQHMMDTGSVWDQYTVNTAADSQGNAQGMEITPRDYPFDEVIGRGGGGRGPHYGGSDVDGIGPSFESQQLAMEVVRSMQHNRSTSSSRSRRSYNAPDTVVL